MQRRFPTSDGFSPILLLILIVVLSAAAFAGWKVFEQATSVRPTVAVDQTTKTPEPKNFKECAALKDSVLTTGPASCTTKAGKKFIQEAVVKTALDIDLWHIRLPLTRSVADAFYTKLPNGTIKLSSDQMEIVLNSMEGCHAGFEDLVYQRAQPGDLHDGKSYTQIELEKIAIKVGDHYYFPVTLNGQTCATPATALTEEASNLRHELQVAFSMAQPY